MERPRWMSTGQSKTGNTPSRMKRKSSRQLRVDALVFLCSLSVWPITTKLAWDQGNSRWICNDSLTMILSYKGLHLPWLNPGIFLCVGWWSTKMDGFANSANPIRMNFYEWDEQPRWWSPMHGAWPLFMQGAQDLQSYHWVLLPFVLGHWMFKGQRPPSLTLHNTTIPRVTLLCGLGMSEVYACQVATFLGHQAF